MIVFKIKDLNNSVNPCQSKSLGYQTLQKMSEACYKKREKSATSWENLFMPYSNNKGADQLAHPRSLISTFVVRSPDTIIPVTFTC